MLESKYTISHVRSACSVLAVASCLANMNCLGTPSMLAESDDTAPGSDAESTGGEDSAQASSSTTGEGSPATDTEVKTQVDPSQTTPDLIPLLVKHGYAHPRWSPDGTELLAWYNVDQRLELHLVNATDGSVEVVDGLSERVWKTFEWSPTGERMAYVRERGLLAGWNLVVRNTAATDDLIEIKGIDSGCGMSWSPDGKFLAYAAFLDPDADQPSSEIHVIDMDGASVYSSKGLEGYHKCNPSWSRDGASMLYWSQVEPDEVFGGTYIELLRPNADWAKQRIHTARELTARQASWSTGGAYAFSGGNPENGPTGVMSGHPSGKLEWILDADEGFGASTPWHPTLELMAVTGTYEHDLALFDPRANTLTSLIPNSDFRRARRMRNSESVRDPDWSPDGNRLAYQRGDRLEIIDVSLRLPPSGDRG